MSMPVLRHPARLLILAAAMVLAGCAHGPGADPRDPLEPLNRSVFAFNDAVDRTVLQPVATAYTDITPRPVRTGVRNFFNNLADGWSFVNQLLQGKPAEAMDSFFRFNINTLWGVFGLIDIASEMRIESRHEDFGQTLGRWGVPSGPYLVLPLMGPSTVRDAAARLTVDVKADPVRQADHVPTRNSLIALDVVQTRAQLLQATRMLDEAALDRYSFTRDIYLQKRQNDVFDGAPPPPDAPTEEPAEATQP
ncbi:MAG: VacJ family lipoprotein [Tibeticola sp.]|nr:VacJ family lipoprotein [Tibeticola sp.]